MPGSSPLRGKALPSNPLALARPRLPACRLWQHSAWPPAALPCPRRASAGQGLAAECLCNVLATGQLFFKPGASRVGRARPRAAMLVWTLRKGSAPPAAAAAERPRDARPRETAGRAAALRPGPHLRKRSAGQKPEEARPEKRRRAAGAVDPLAFHEPASETKAERQQRRGTPGPRACSRCRWYAMEDRWAKTVGAFSGPSAPQKRSWIAERPARWGGPWGLRRSLCSLSLNRGIAESADACPRVTAGQSRRLCTQWARFEVRPAALQAEAVAHPQDRASRLDVPGRTGQVEAPGVAVRR